MLNAVPDSMLLVTAAGAERRSGARESILRRLAGYGVDPERVLLAGKASSRREYLRRYCEIDICLDAYPFNGITTTCDGLWMGVPTVTGSGRTGVSRATRSILASAGLGDWAAETPEEWVDVAAALAKDTKALGELRRRMRKRLAASALLDPRRFTASLESAYRRMWRTWAGGAGKAAIEA